MPDASRSVLLAPLGLAIVSLGCPDTSCPPGSHDEGGRCITDTDTAVFDGGRPDAPRPDARPSLDAPPDTRLGPCPSVLDRLPTCTDAPSTSYCEDLTSSVIDVPDALFEQFFLSGPDYPTHRVGVLPDVPVLLDVPAAGGLSEMSSDLVGNNLYFGFFGVHGGYLGQAEFIDFVRDIDVMAVGGDGVPGRSRVSVAGAQALFAAGTSVWGPVPIPAAGRLGDPTFTTALDASVGFSGETPVVTSGVGVVQPAGVPPFSGVSGPGRVDVLSATQLVYTSGADSNAAIHLRYPELGQVALGPGQIRVTVSNSDPSTDTYEVVDTSMLLAEGSVRLRTMSCGTTHCPLSDPPRLLSVGVQRQNVQDFAYVQFDRSTGRQALVVAYVEATTNRLRVDVAYWFGAPIEVHWLPIAVLDSLGVSGGLQAFTDQGPLAATGGWKLDLIVVMNTYDNDLNRAVRVAAVRLAGCP